MAGNLSLRPRWRDVLVWGVAALVSIAWLVTALPLAAADPLREAFEPVKKEFPLPPVRFKFTIDPATPLNELLPMPPDADKALLPWEIKNFGQVPEILFERVIHPNPKMDLETRHEAVKRIAHGIAKINHLNQKETDYFLKVLIQKRPDLQGLPFVMGDDCRMSKDVSAAFAKVVRIMQEADRGLGEKESHRFVGVCQSRLKADFEGAKQPERIAAEVAAFVQILGPRPQATRRELVSFLTEVQDIHSTGALAGLAVFSFEKDVRQAALDALKSRPEKEVTETLLRGLRYPWPTVNENAGEAIASLQRKDLIPELLKALDEPEPWAPRETEDKKYRIREVVRLNHHRSCLLCHPPANTPDAKLDDFGQAEGFVTGAVPVPGQPFSSGRAYDPSASPDIFVRADVTYLRQDFSLMQPVEDAAPWPRMQRFDFLVREREVTREEAATFQAWRKKWRIGYVPAHHLAVHEALLALTQLECAQPTATAWRKVLGMP